MKNITCLGLMFVLLMACGKSDDQNTTASTDPVAFPTHDTTDLATIPAGQYSLSAIEVEAESFKSGSTARFKHTLTNPGTFDREHDQFSVTPQWKADDTEKRIYVWLNTPMKLAANGTSVDFLNPKFYKPYAGAVEANGNLVIWENDSGLRFSAAVLSGQKEGNTYRLEAPDAPKIEVTARRLNDESVSVYVRAEFNPSGRIPFGAPRKYSVRLDYTR